MDMEKKRSVYEVSSLEQFKALSHKLRVQILNLFADWVPLTSKQMADRMDMSASKVHYHVRELHRVGLLELVETREKGGVIEKYYLPIAEEIRIRMQDGGDGEAAFAQQEMVRATVDEYLEAYQKARDRIIRLKEAGQEIPDRNKMTTGMAFLQLNEEELESFKQDLHEVMLRWEARVADRRDGETPVWRMFYSIFPNQ